MAYLTESATFDEGIYRIETTDAVIGGESGISNMGAKGLANRTTYLKQEQDTIKSKLNAAGIGAASLYTGDLNSLVTSGLHYADTGYTNGPIAETGTVLVNGKDANNVTQFFYGLTSGAMYVRRKLAGAWQAWQRVLIGDDSNSLVLPGSIISFAKITPPTGYVKCNGAELSRSTYANLFSAIGLGFGKRGNKVSGTLNATVNSVAHGYSTGQAVTVSAEQGVGLPSPLVDGTVYYLRVISPASYQIHPTSTDAANNTAAITLATGDAYKFYASTLFPVPDLRGEFVRGWDDARGVDSARVFGLPQDDTFEAHTHTVNRNNLGGAGAGSFVAGSNTANATTTTSSTGGTETRPRNIALSYFIKY